MHDEIVYKIFDTVIFINKVLSTALFDYRSNLRVFPTEKYRYQDETAQVAVTK